MTMLTDYTAFSGRHHETGSIQNVLAYQGVKAPHTGEAISEALLMGISGGANFGYFTFAYEGYQPHVAILTRNTFDPLQTLLERFPIPHEMIHTSKAEKGESNLREVLEGGRPAVIWADMFTLPHYALPYDEHNWAMMPMVCYGIDGDTAYLADRSSQAIAVPMDTLTKARARIKKDKFRVMLLDEPKFENLQTAVNKGIWQCINIFTEAPPKGKRDNFGLAGLQQWAKMLTNTRNKNSWARYFPAGSKMWSGIAGDCYQPGAYGWIHKQGDNNSAERGMYADFLDEASTILNNDGLKQAGVLFRKSEAEWAKLLDLLLPDDVPLFKQVRDLKNRKDDLYVRQGSDAIDAIREINAQLNQMRDDAETNFPFDDAQVVAYRERLAEQVLVIHDAERDAIDCLQSAMV